MAIYHLSVKLVTRGAGRSATAAIAYRAATRVPDERTGLVFDYSRKRGVEHTEIVLPTRVAESAEWARDRAQLWNAAEAVENRKDARVAREYEVALLHGFAQEIAARHGCAVDVAIHAPHREGDARNHHAHILATTRAVTEGGLGAKTDIELKDADRTKRGLCSGKHEITAIRERWATLVNEHLAAHGRSERIDHRSLAEQGEEREPTFYKGPAVTALERRAERSFVSERTCEEVTERLRAAAELGRLERESGMLERAIIDTTSRLEAVLATRHSERSLSLEHIRRDAQVAWLASRAAHAATPPQTPQAPRTLDLSGDVASARREARERWLADRQGAQPPELAPQHEDVHGKRPVRITLPDDDHAK